MGCTANKLIISPGENKRRLSKHSSLDIDQEELVYIPLESNHYSDFQSLYTPLSQISKGKFGSVILARSHITGKEVAVKIQPRQHESQVLSELNNALSLNHPNILKPQECFQDTQFYYIVSEYLSGGELIKQPNQKFPEQYTKKIVYKLLSAVNHMHSLRIAHRDLKPENILLDCSGDIRIIDFGLSKRFIPGVPMKDVVGTPQYMAPEILNCEYGPECDLWSVGIILYTMLVGEPPSLGKGKEEKLMRLRSGNLGIEFKGLEIPDKAQTLLEGLLNKNPEKRISCKDALKHKWFSDKSSSKSENSKLVLNSLIPKEKLPILGLAYSFLEPEDTKKATKIFRKLDSQKSGLVHIQIANQPQTLNYSDFVIHTMRQKIIDQGIPLLYNWCFKDSKYSPEILRKTLLRKGSYISSTQYTQFFESLSDFQRYLS